MSLFRVYFDPTEIGDDGYPYAWHHITEAAVQNGPPNDGPILNDPIKDIVREQADHRCVRCGHPYTKGDGEWSACDEQCTHGGPVRLRDLHEPEDSGWRHFDLQDPSYETRIEEGPNGPVVRYAVEARWRILTVHHLNGVKHDCRWWNLVALCQRCHLTIQGKVHMQRPWRREHSEWFKPYVAAFYAFEKLGEGLTREETMERLDELLALEDVQGSLL